MRFEYYIGVRYLKLKQKQTFISLITLLSIAGVTVGVMALIVVIAVMAGFESDLKTRILAGQSHIILEQEKGPFTAYKDILAALNDIEGVEASTPFIYSQIMLRSPSGAIGAVLRGVHPDTAGDVIKALKGVPLLGPSEKERKENHPDAPAGIVLGRELARSLGVGTGNDVYLISPRGMLAPAGHIPSMKRFRVSGFFESGMYEFDGTFAFIHIRDAQKIMRMPGAVSGNVIRVADIFNADRIARDIMASINH